MSEVYPLQDRIALVTGASSGLRRHFGLLLAANGAHLALAARSIDRVADSAKAIPDQGGKALDVALDVTVRASEIGREACRAIVCQYVSIYVVAGSFTKKTSNRIRNEEKLN